MSRGGKRDGAGRKPGVPNKITGELKEMILTAADLAGNEISEDGAGGTVAYLKQAALTQQSAFLALLGKVLPLTLAGPGGEPLQAVFQTVYEQSPDQAQHPLVSAPVPRTSGNGASRESH